MVKLKVSVEYEIYAINNEILLGWAEQVDCELLCLDGRKKLPQLGA